MSILDDSVGIGIADNIPQADLEVNNTLRLTPTDTPNHAIEGALYYDDSDDRLRVHTATGWQDVGRIFPTPDYESSWTAWPAGSRDMTFTHNLGTLDYIVYLEGKDNAAVTGIHQKMNVGGVDAAWFRKKTTDSVEVHRHEGDDAWDEVKVRLWRY